MHNGVFGPPPGVLAGVRGKTCDPRPGREMDVQEIGSQPRECITISVVVSINVPNTVC